MVWIASMTMNAALTIIVITLNNTACPALCSRRLSWQPDPHVTSLLNRSGSCFGTISLLLAKDRWTGGSDIQYDTIPATLVVGLISYYFPLFAGSDLGKRIKIKEGGDNLSFNKR
ncbi:hypothetical protein K503DRAFT_32127 [Rhizopogon vinicolor AM-OR11-026]|uniref:Uncharacterized protein n=1 Tax=Rhizopogon vinicolor AM-OR11-026 TaxID=1314800 RepID=A0A1B7MH60_9AGAM|nr:hypothetical protein K503DRAFT_32127 [Rhizopogon vinicolor AM-OR11-026]